MFFLYNKVFENTGFLSCVDRLAVCIGLTLLGLWPVAGHAQTATRVAQPNPALAAPRRAASVALGTGTGTVGKSAPAPTPALPAPSAQNQITNDSIYADPPVAAVFPGGMPALGAYIGANMRFPEKARLNGVTGRVLVQFILGKDGRVQDVHVMSGPGAGLNEEAYRLVWLMPPWEPGRLANGQPVRANCTLPIMFRAAEK